MCWGILALSVDAFLQNQTLKPGLGYCLVTYPCGLVCSLVFMMFYKKILRSSQNNRIYSGLYFFSFSYEALYQTCNLSCLLQNDY